MKYCVNCIHHVPDTVMKAEPGKYDKCNSPMSYTDINLVTGQKVQKYNGYCQELRSGDSFCGLAANWFSPKDLLADLGETQQPEKKLEVLDILTAEKPGNL